MEIPSIFMKTICIFLIIYITAIFVDHELYKIRVLYKWRHDKLIIYMYLYENKLTFKISGK